MTSGWRRILRYVIWVYAVSYLLQLGIWFGGGLDGHAFAWLAPAVMFVPGVIALIQNRHRLSPFQWRFRGLVYLLIAAVLPAIAAVVSCATIQASGIGESETLRFTAASVLAGHRIFLLGSGEQSYGFFVVNLLVSAVAFAVVGGLLAFGEELGWRGYLQGELVRQLGLSRGVALLGLVWAYWHLPVVLMGYNYPATPVLGAMVLLPLVGIGLSYFLAGVTLGARSLWPAVIGHGSVNAFFGVLVYSMDFHAPRLWGDGIVIVATSILGALGWWLARRSLSRLERN